MNWINIILWNCTALIGYVSYFFDKSTYGWLVMGINCTLASIVMLTYEKRIDILEKGE